MRFAISWDYCAEYPCQSGPLPSGGVCGRGLPSLASGSAHASARATRAARPPGLRVPAHGHSQPVHDYGAFCRLAVRGGDGAPHETGLRPDPEGPGGRTLSAGAAHHFGLRQSNLHKPAVLYERFEAATARRIARRLEWVHTPKHASWLHSAEIEIHVLTRQALARRIPDADALCAQVTAWQETRNQLGAPVNWRFTTDDARIKLQSLYPPV